MKNEKGITLIELLAATAILLFISSLIYGVLISTNKNFNQINDKNNLEEEANLIISTIKNYHQQEDYYWLTYNNEEQKAYIGKDSPNILLGSDIVTFEVSNENGPLNLNEKINTNHYIFVHIVLKKQSENPVEFTTVIKRY